MAVAIQYGSVSSLVKNNTKESDITLQTSSIFLISPWLHIELIQKYWWEPKGSSGHITKLQCSSCQPSHNCYALMIQINKYSTACTPFKDPVTFSSGHKLVLVKRNSRKQGTKSSWGNHMCLWSYEFPPTYFLSKCSTWK